MTPKAVIWPTVQTNQSVFTQQEPTSKGISEKSIIILSFEFSIPENNPVLDEINAIKLQYKQINNK